MGDALTPLLITAAIVLCAAGAGKLRSPASAVRAVRTLGLPASAPAVRVLAAVELTVGVVCIVHPVRPVAFAVALLYAIFSVTALALARRSSSCGCFGESEAPASVFQSALSAMIALLALTAAFSTPHGLGWLFTRTPANAAVLSAGIAGAAYAIVLAYRELPQAWQAWSRS